MSNNLSVDPLALSRRRATLDGPTGSRQFSRLSAALADAADEVTIDWQARFIPADETSHGYAGLQLSCQADLAIPCVRCLAGVTVPVRVDQHFCLVRDENRAATMDQEASDYDVIAVGEQWSLLALIEDELLLALPIMPRHENCEPHPALAGDAGDNAGSDDADDDRQFPFAGLASQLKKSQH